MTVYIDVTIRNVICIMFPSIKTMPLSSVFGIVLFFLFSVGGVLLWLIKDLDDENV